MRKLVVFLLCCTLAHAAGRNLVNANGGILLGNTIVNGPTTHGSGIIQYDNVDCAAYGNPCGWVSFVTGPLLSGSIADGGTFSATGSSVSVLTKGGIHGVPPGTIFTGSFIGTITWVYCCQVGDNDSFILTGPVSGTLENGTVVTGILLDIVEASPEQLAEGVGYIEFGTLNLK